MKYTKENLYGLFADLDVTSCLTPMPDKAEELINYVLNLQEENQQLKEQLKQIDEDINFCLVSVKQEMEMSTDERTRKEMKTCYEILNKYKGDNNE